MPSAFRVGDDFGLYSGIGKALGAHLRFRGNASGEQKPKRSRRGDEADPNSGKEIFRLLTSAATGSPGLFRLLTSAATGVLSAIFVHGRTVARMRLGVNRG